MLVIYAYRNCDTCRKATKWLDGRGIPYQTKAIRTEPPTVEELKTALAANGGELKKLFNVSGTDYRELGMKEKLPRMDVTEALELLSANGNLVKRPFAVGGGVALAGFNETEWTATFG